MFKLIIAVILLCYINATPIDENNILLYFYSPASNNISASIPLNRSQFNTVKLNTTTDVKVIIHGYQIASTDLLVQSMIEAYLASGEHNNIIFLDWSKYSNMNYPELYAIKDQVVKIMAQDLIGFSEANKIPISKYHVIGISYGGQLAGLIGQEIYNKTGSKLTRITALDPAGPLFLAAPQNNRLDASDAIFVDVIHTSLFLGYFNPCGTVDFWPNGGYIQPNCPLLRTCSHFRAVEYFIESINSKKFTAWECFNILMFEQGLCEEGSVVVMGEHVNISATGQYFLHTNPTAPYACMC